MSVCLIYSYVQAFCANLVQWWSIRPRFIAHAFCKLSAIRPFSQTPTMARAGEKKKKVMQKGNCANHRFNKLSSELLVCFSCLDPRNSFSKFDVDKLARIADIYYDDFSFDDNKTIKDQLQTFIIHVRRLEEFKACYDLASV
jgi:hypothetical protein